MNYKTITSGGDSLVEAKRSKFIGIIRPVSSEEDALAVIKAEKKKYHDARHHCSAYIIRNTDGLPDIVHSSDDGEPSGTAGAPILEVIKGADLKDVVLVVTRYFGGTLLGIGGLVRAYTDAAKGALEAAVISEMKLMQEFSLFFDYTHTGIIDHYIKSNAITILDKLYTEKVEYKLACTEDLFDKVCPELTDLTNSSVRIEKGSLTYAAAES